MSKNSFNQFSYVSCIDIYSFIYFYDSFEHVHIVCIYAYHIISNQITGHCYSSRWIHSCTCTHLFRWFSIFNFHALVCPKAVYSSAVRVFRIHQLLMFELFLFSPRFGSPLAIIALVDGCVISRPEQIKIEKQFAFIVRNSFTHLCVFYWSCLWCFFIYSILLHIWPQITRSRLRFT